MYNAGIDVSKWQGQIDWQAVKDQGITWACARIGIGWSYIDPRWAENLEGAKAVGLPMGGYYVPSFQDYDVNPDAFINNLENGLEESNLKPDFLINDVEKFSANANRRWNREICYRLSRWMWEYLDRDAKRVWQYNRALQFNIELGDGEWAIDSPGADIPSFASDYPLFTAHYRASPGQDWREYLSPGGMPNIATAWTPSTDKYRGDFLGWNVWQVIDSAKNFEGVQSLEIDIDLMKPEFFERMFGGITPPPPPPPPPPSGELEERVQYLELIWKRIHAAIHG
jgi:hypothetical protein